MKVLARAKMPKTSQRDFLVAHRYTICDGISVRSPRGLADSCCLPRAVKREHCAFPSVQRAHLPICILCVQ